jgi:hypothetical protein
MNSGKLIKLNDSRSIYLLYNNDNDSYFFDDNIIKFRNIGKDFDVAIVNENYYQIKNDTLHVLDAASNPIFYFPIIWLNQIQMKINELFELGILTQN